MNRAFVAYVFNPVQLDASVAVNVAGRGGSFGMTVYGCFVCTYG